MNLDGKQRVFEVGQKVKLPPYFTASQGTVAGAAAFADGEGEQQIYCWWVRISLPGRVVTVVINGAHLEPMAQHGHLCPTCTCTPLDNNS